MVIEVFNDGKSVHLLDSWERLKITENWYSTNAFELDIGYSKDLIRMIIPETVLLIEGLFYYVDRVKSDGNKITISGRSLGHRINRRIIKHNYKRQGRPAFIAYDLIRSYVEFMNVVQPSSFGNSIRYQDSYGNVLESVEALCETYDFGFVENPKTIYEPSVEISFVEGRDVSDVVEFSTHFENLMGDNYENSTYDEANMAYVFGEGEGADRKMVLINNNLTGLARKELYVDARDIQSKDGSTTLTPAQYEAELIQRGLEKLSARSKILTLDGTIDVNDKLYTLGKDYRLGDIVTIRSEKFNLRKKQRITKLEKTWDKEGFHLDPVFGKEAPTIFEVISRKRG